MMSKEGNISILKTILIFLKIIYPIHLNGVFAPLNTGLLQISRWHFKQSKKLYA